MRIVIMMSVFNLSLITLLYPYTFICCLIKYTLNAHLNKYLQDLRS